MNTYISADIPASSHFEMQIFITSSNASNPGIHKTQTKLVTGGMVSGPSKSSSERKDKNLCSKGRLQTPRKLKTQPQYYTTVLMKIKLKHISEHELGIPVLLTHISEVCGANTKISKNVTPRKRQPQDTFRQTKEAIPNSKLCIQRWGKSMLRLCSSRVQLTIGRINTKQLMQADAVVSSVNSYPI